MSSGGPLVLAIPVFNGETYLRDTLESMAAQGSDVRWWLQDGASTDQTVEIARSFVRPGDQIQSEPDSGQPEALNRAFAKMGGEIVGFLNADDTLTPNTARRVLEYFSAHPDIDLIYGSVEWMDAQGKTMGHHRGRIDSLAEMLDIYRVWWRDRQWVQPEVFFRRSLFERTAGFQPKWNLAFDYEFWVQCMRAGARVACVPEITVRFRLHTAQKSTAAERAADDIRGIVQEHLPHAAIGAWKRAQIRADLEYDLYQLGKDRPPGAGRPTFSSALLRHPNWLLAHHARRRIQSSLAKAIGFGRRKTK